MTSPEEVLLVVDAMTGQVPKPSSSASFLSSFLLLPPRSAVLLSSLAFSLLSAPCPVRLGPAHSCNEQEAANLTKEFNQAVGITGAILTKV